MGLRAQVDAAGSRRSAVEGAVSVSKGEPLRGCSFDAQPAAVKRSMMSGAKREEIVELFGAAFGTEIQMMDVDEGRMPGSVRIPVFFDSGGQTSFERNV